MRFSKRPQQEEWRVIPGFEAYEASTWGRVRRCKPYRSTTVGRVLATETQRGGHLLVRLGVGKLQPKAMSVHRLVAFTFIGPAPSPDHLVAHGDGTPTHNWPDNLSWKTPKENTADRVLHGTDPAGERNPNARLTDLQVQLIRAHHNIGMTSKAVLSRLFGVSDAHLTRLIRGDQRRQAGGYLS